MGKYHNDVNGFWDNFRQAVIENGVPEKYADWYVFYKTGVRSQKSGVGMFIEAEGK